MPMGNSQWDQVPEQADSTSRITRRKQPHVMDLTLHGMKFMQRKSAAL